MLKKREIILFGLEPSYQGSVTLTAADNAIQVFDASWANEGLRMHEQSFARSSLGGSSSIYGGSLKAVTFSFLVKGSGAAGTTPDYDPVLQCAGMDETTSAGVSNTFSFISSAIPSGKMHYYQDGYLHTLTGCRTTALSFSLPTGDRVVATATVVGHISSEGDASLVSQTIDATDALIFKGASFAIGGYSPAISSLTIDCGIKSILQPNPNSADSYGEVLVTGRKITGSIDPQAVLAATNDWLGDFRSNVKGTLATGTIGSTAGNRIAFTLTDVQATEITDGDRDGETNWPVTYECDDEGGDDSEFTLVVT